LRGARARRSADDREEVGVDGGRELLAGAGVHVAAPGIGAARRRRRDERDEREQREEGANDDAARLHVDSYRAARPTSARRVASSARTIAVAPHTWRSPIAK